MILTAESFKWEVIQCWWSQWCRCRFHLPLVRQAVKGNSLLDYGVKERLSYSICRNVWSLSYYSINMKETHWFWYQLDCKECCPGVMPISMSFLQHLLIVFTCSFLYLICVLYSILMFAVFWWRWYCLFICYCAWWWYQFPVSAIIKFWFNL